jgi:hypothetical protein
MVVVVVVAANTMEKFILGNSGSDPSIRTANDANVARFVHLNRMVEDYQTFTTIISAEQAATLASTPVELNVPEGMYALAGGYIYYSSTATEDLELGGEQLVLVNSTMAISKNAVSTLSPGQLTHLSTFGSFSTNVSSGKLTFTTDADSGTTPDGPVEVTVYLTKLNLSII